MAALFQDFEDAIGNLTRLGEKERSVMGVNREFDDIAASEFVKRDSAKILINRLVRLGVTSRHLRDSGHAHSRDPRKEGVA